MNQEPTSFEYLELGKIRPNPLNPHAENLRESIAEFGVLVPLVVRRISKDDYQLIDGERRYWAAKSLKKPKVPAYIVEGPLDKKALLQRMFQIHMNRDQWDAVQQCRASEELFAELKAEHGDDIQKLSAALARFTGDDLRTARNRVQFLSWPQDLKEEIYSDAKKHSSYWYVVEIEDKIVEPAQRNFPEYFERVRVDDVRRFLYRKWEENTVGPAVDVREAAAISRASIPEKRRRRKALAIFDKLVKDVEFTYQEALKEFAIEFPEMVEPKLPKPRALLAAVRSLASALSQYDPQFLDVYGKKKAPSTEDIVNAVRSLVEAAQGFLKRLRGSGRHQ
jgi:ParB/RepB/Spo0J family partition protein